jgi:hypothetical protein
VVHLEAPLCGRFQVFLKRDAPSFLVSTGLYMGGGGPSDF